MTTARKRSSETLSTNLYLTDEEYAMLLSNLEAMKELNMRNAALIYTAMLTGARASEVLGLRPKDIDQARGTLFIRGKKNSYDRAIPVRPWLIKMLLKLVEHPKQELVFKIKYRQMVNIWYQVSPVEKKLHCLRHTRAMRALQLTGDPSVVKTGLGHKSFMSTQVYLDHHSSAERLKKFME